MRLLVYPLLLSLAVVVANKPAQSFGPEDLLGTWQVDLRPTPEADPYYQTFVVTSVEGGVLEGVYYNSPIAEGRINTDWGAVHFAFVTSDGSGPYNTSGVLDGDTLRGTTHSLGREFLAVWTAVRSR